MATQKGQLNMPNGDIMHLETDAGVTKITDAGGYFTSSDAEGALQELGAKGSSSVAVSDTTSVNLTLTDGTITADVIFGTTTGVAVAGDDSRLSDARTPLAHNQTASTITDFATAALTAAPAETATTIGTLINGATAKTTPVDADLFALSDSAASNVVKKMTFANLKTALGGVLAPAAHNQTASTITDFQTTVSSNTDVAANTTARHTHSNQTTLDSITAAYTTTEQTKLAGIAENAQVNNISDTNATDLTDGGDSTLHYHTADRNRANHSGTQTASTISDFSSAALTAAPAETTTTIGTLILGATAKTTPVDADLFALSDSAASNIIKKMTFANLKTALGGVLAPAAHTHTKSQVTDFPASTSVSVTLATASWTGASAPYSITVTVTGVTATSNQDMIPATTITADQYNALAGAKIIGYSQTTNSVTLRAWGTKPAVDIPVVFIIRGV